MCSEFELLLSHSISNCHSLSLPVCVSVSWLCCVLLLLPRVAKLMINFDSTRRRDSMRGSGETIPIPIPKHPQRQPVSVAAYYCVFVPTVAVRFRSSTQLSSSPLHAHTHTTAYRHHTHTTQLNSHARSLFVTLPLSRCLVLAEP